MKFKSLLAACALLALAGVGRADVKDALVRVKVGDKCGSGTCVWRAADGVVSVVATNNHFDNTGHADAVVTHGTKTLYGSILPGDKGADVALVVVAGDIPAAEVRRTPVTVGENVWHKGGGSGGGAGKVVFAQPSTHQTAFRTTASSTSGDSGAGIFDERNRLVAVHAGRYDPKGENLQYGGQAPAVLALLEKVGAVQVIEYPTPTGPIRVARQKGAQVARPAAAPVMYQPAPVVMYSQPSCANGRCFR
jgi:hypothetical protein